VGDIKQQLALQGAAAALLSDSVAAALKGISNLTEVSAELVAELRKERSEREWNEILATREREEAARRAAAEPKRLMGRTPMELSLIIIGLALVIIAALLGVRIPGVLQILGGGGS
jgi:hypothetical protein